ncbi:helix-turn-helix domain-containing protein [Mariniluteicoccus flavus]
MASSSLDALLHPVRWRVVQVLTAGPMSTRDLHERLPDVAQATLYRQIGPLVDAGLVRVVDETPVRGAVERTYALGRGLTADDLADLEDYRRVGLFLLAQLQADLDAYLDGVPGDPARDGLSLTRTLVHVDDAGLARLQEGLQGLVGPLVAPAEGTRPLALGLVLVPSVD